MAVATTQITFAEAIYQVALHAGLVRYQGTATAGTTTSLPDATNMRVPTAQANEILGKYLLKRGGTGAGEFNEIKEGGYAIGVMTWQTADTAPTSTTTWALLAIHPGIIVSALQDVQRAAAFSHAQPHPSEAIVFGSLIQGAFEEWPDGVTSKPQGWETPSNATLVQLTSSTTPARVQGGFGMQILDTSSGTGYIDAIVPQRLYLKLEGQTLYMKGVIVRNASRFVFKPFF